MDEISKLAAFVDVRRNDRVAGWFGEGIVTDVAHGYLTDQITGDRVSEDDDMVRIEQFDKHNNRSSRYIYRTDIERNYTAEDSILRS
jgi:hypothetical protein